VIEQEYTSATESPEAVSIVWTNRNTFTGTADNRFDDVFGTSAPAAQAVVDAALQAWQRVITSWNRSDGTSTMQVNISMDPSATGLGGAGGPDATAPADGKPRTGSITINRGNVTPDPNDSNGWYLDPFPNDYSEFQGAILNPFAGNPTAGVGGELYSVVAAEITHVLGLISPKAGGQGANFVGYGLIGSGYTQPTGQRDNAEGGGTSGYFYAFNGPSISHAMTSYNSGDSDDDSWGNVIHTAGGTANFTHNGVNYRGTDDDGNAAGGGERTLPSWVTAHILADAYGYSIDDPARFGTLYSVLDSSNVNPGTLTIRGVANSDDRIIVSRFGSTLTVSVDIGNDVPGSGASSGADNLPAWVSEYSTLQVQRIVINTDSGNDGITLLALDDIPVTVTGGAGDDWLDITGDAGNNNLTFTSTSIIGSRNNITSYSGLETIYAHGQSGSDIFSIESLPLTNLQLFGDDENDQVIWGGNGANLNSVAGGGTFLGGSGADTMVLNDASHGGPRTYTYDLGSITDGFSNYGYVAGNDVVENVIINGAAGGGLINADWLFAGVNYTVNGGSGDDTATIGGSFQSLVTAQGNFTLNGNGGSDTLMLNDQGGSSTSYALTNSANFVIPGAGTVSLSGTEAVTLNTSNVSNSVNLASTQAGVTYTVNGSSAGTGFSLAAGTQNLSLIQGNVNLNGHTGSYSTLVLNNQAGAAENMTIGSGPITFPNASFGYSNISYVTLNLSDSQTSVVHVTGLAAPTTINLGFSSINDIVYLELPAGNVSGVLQVQGGTNGTFQVSDSALPSSAPITYSLNGATVMRGSFFVNALVPSISLSAGAGDDAFTLNNIAGTIVVNGGGGVDQVTQSHDPAALGEPYDTAFWRALVTDTQVRHLYRTSPPPSGPYTLYGAVNYSQIDRFVINNDPSAVEIYSTPPDTNFDIHGGGLRLGSSTYIGTGNGSVENIRSLIQFFGDSGTVPTLTIDDGADTTTDTARLEPGSISNGPGAPLFSAGGRVQFYNVTTVRVIFGSGADTIYVTPTSQTTFNIYGQDPTTLPGDTLNLAFAAATNPVFTPNGAGAGGYTFANAHPLNYTGIESVNIDAVAPSVLSANFDYNAGRQSLTCQFSEDVSASITPASLNLVNLATLQTIPAASISALYNSATNSAMFEFPGFPNGVLPDGDYRAELLPGSVSDPFGNTLPATYILNFFFLNGDADRDAAVDSDDFNILASNFGQSNRTFSQGDFNYDGTVNSDDFNILAGRFGSVLSAQLFGRRTIHRGTDVEARERLEQLS